MKRSLSYLFYFILLENKGFPSFPRNLGHHSIGNIKFIINGREKRLDVIYVITQTHWVKENLFGLVK
jgi:hypothetical protein